MAKKVTKIHETPIDERETFVSASRNINESDGISMEEKIQILYKIQQTDTEIDKIHLLRGELPLEVQDLEDEIEGLNTRIANTQNDIKEQEKNISLNKNAIEANKANIAKYEEQRNNVRNNREYDSISHEIEYCELDIEASEKKIREANLAIAKMNETVAAATANLEVKEADLKVKKEQLETIIEETAKEEDQLNATKEELAAKIEQRMFAAYNRVRNASRNHLAVVPLSRGACGGCFNQIPPQRQLDIMQSKKIIVCEYCGRILVNPELSGETISE